jgi:ABC-type phosphate/phosphonate transport system ATPase subunit
MKKPNPFSTCFTAPGQIEFVESDYAVDDLAGRIASDKRCFQVVGAHGSGKTTLTIAIANRLQGIDCHWITFRQAKRLSFPNVQFQDYPKRIETRDATRSVIFIDGIECLSWLQRMTMLQAMSNSKWQPVVTSHRRLVGIAVLAELKSTLDSFRRLAMELHAEKSRVWDEAIESAFHDNNGNVREGFFQLYDFLERQSKLVSQSSL